MGMAEVCEQHVASLPAHNQVGEGIDVTTMLGWTRAYLMDTSLGCVPNGTCSLCQNPLQGREVETPPSSLLIPHFSRALRRLPPTCSLDMYRALLCHIRHPLQEPGSTGGLMAIDSEVGCWGLLGLDGEPQSQPGWGSYSLLPIYTLVGPEDPRWEALRWVVKEYVAERGQRRSCPRGCPEGGYAVSWDVCKC
ncbi:unnamed protein product [Lepidochelys kempii]